MATSTTLLSLAEFQELPDNGMLHELSEGELIEMPPPKYAHSHVAHRFYEVLIERVTQQGRGKLLIEAGFQLSMDPPTVRQPDLAFVTLARLPDPAAEAWIPGGPELAIEVVSPSDTAEDLNRRVQQYLAAGTGASVDGLSPHTASPHPPRGPSHCRTSGERHP